MRRRTSLMAVSASALLIASACNQAAAPAGTSGATSGAAAATVSLQLQWEPQAQFAGYFAADKQGYYKAENLTVNIVKGGATIAPQTAGSAANGPEFTIAWQPKVLEAREQGSDLVNIGQIFQRSGTRSVSWKDSNITKPTDFKGKKVGVWDFGNEFEVTAGAKKAGLEQNKDYTKVIQPFDMTLLLSRQIDVAEAMIYNEYAQMLEAKDPETGKLHTADQLNVIDWNNEGSAMLQDALFARAAWLKQPGNEDVAVRFLRASMKGWIYCRDHQADCIQYTVDAGSTLGAGHQKWMMNEILPLIFPSSAGIGIMPKDFWDQTVKVSTEAAIIKAAPPADAYRTDLAQKALDSMTGIDTKGADYKKGVVEVTEGGK